jgi:hypothetical protein
VEGRERVEESGGREKKVGKAVLQRREFGMVVLRTSIVTLADVVWLANLGKRVWSSEVEYPQIAAAAVAHWLESLPASFKGTS